MMRKFLAADMAFHTVLIRAAGNGRIMKIINDTHVFTRIFGVERQKHDMRIVGDAYQVHCQILDAVERGNPESARQLMARHIRGSMKQTLDHYDRVVAETEGYRSPSLTLPEEVLDDSSYRGRPGNGNRPSTVPLWSPGRSARSASIIPRSRWRYSASARLRFPGVDAADSGLSPLKYNNPGLVVDLGVGLWAWPLPMDFDGDGDLDLVVTCPDKPYNGTYFFENPGGNPQSSPCFNPARGSARGLQRAGRPTSADQARVLSPGQEYPDFRPIRPRRSGRSCPCRPTFHPNKVRANQWRYVDYDGDGPLDLIVGVGDWTDYGWDNAFDADGQWTHGPLHGYVYLVPQHGHATRRPHYAKRRVKIEAGGKPVEVFGMPSPNLADFDGDGDLDLLCGEFLDGFTYFENIGTRTEPQYAAGPHARSPDGRRSRWTCA